MRELKLLILVILWVWGVSGGGGGDGEGLVTLLRMALLTGRFSANGLTGEVGWGPR